jgi:hypothetical protein
MRSPLATKEDRAPDVGTFACASVRECHLTQAGGRRRGSPHRPSMLYACAMSRIDDRLGELGLKLPSPMAPPGNFELVTVHAGIAYVAGHAPIDGSTVLVQGTVAET